MADTNNPALLCPFALIGAPVDAAALAAGETAYQAEKVTRDAARAAHYAAVRAEREIDCPGITALLGGE